MVVEGLRDATIRAWDLPNL